MSRIGCWRSDWRLGGASDAHARVAQMRDRETRRKKRIFMARQDVCSNAPQMEAPISHQRVPHPFTACRRANATGWTVSIQMHDAALDGGDSGLGAVEDAEFFQDVSDVAFDGHVGNIQGDADLLVGLASHNQVEHFQFAFA